MVTIDDLKLKVNVEEHGHQWTQHECMLNGKGSTGTFVGVDVMSLN
jgi:hypothetical protein